MRKKTIMPAALAFLLLGLLAPASTLAAPSLSVSETHVPSADPVPAGTYARYEVAVSNAGPDATSGAVTVNLTVPAGLKIAEVDDEIHQQFGFPWWDCAIAGDQHSLSCSGPDGFGVFGGPLPIGAGAEACTDTIGFPCRLLVLLRADEHAALGAVAPTITVCGGGQTSCPTPAATAPENPFEIGPFGFKITRFDGEVLRSNGDPATQAGSTPYTAATDFLVSSGLAGGDLGVFVPIENFQDVSVELPPGLVGNPTAYPTCAQSQISSGQGILCPAESQVGAIRLKFFEGGSGSFDDEVKISQPLPVYNMNRPQGFPALFAFSAVGVIVYVYPKLRTGEDYGLTVLSKNSPQTLPLKGIEFTFWGVPGDPAHTPERMCPGTFTFGCAGSDSKPFVSLPTSCVGPVETSLRLSGWEGSSDSSSFLSHDNTLPVPNPIGATGCNAVEFAPSIEARPTTTIADAPSGLDFELSIPQNDNQICPPAPGECGTSTAHLRDTTITLPEGLVINPSGANGLDGCSLSEFGFTNREGEVIHTTPDPASCPDASKL
ncbi:MAG TPA: hypothetical protein VN752_06675, partial [Solirubrobacterales bacterium]|nr:hypothetical protein [Solirubrobacterales bacterium]